MDWLGITKACTSVVVLNRRSRIVTVHSAMALRTRSVCRGASGSGSGGAASGGAPFRPGAGSATAARSRSSISFITEQPLFYLPDVARGGQTPLVLWNGAWNETNQEAA